jgi:hypothetical protein
VNYELAGQDWIFLEDGERCIALAQPLYETVIFWLSS